MKIRLSGLNNEMLMLIRAIAQEADKRHVTAYLVGGFVRDIILKRKNLDVDIVIEGDAVVFAKSLARKMKASLVVYKEFGTATLECEGGIRLDLATARKEAYANSGALPVVQPGSLYDDLFRRDFTVNAMAAAINAKRFGECVDPFGGRQDIQKRKIRILHQQSFADDPTRILRAVRFEQRFHFLMERQTLFLLKSALENGSVNHVKPARYFNEFRKILIESAPAPCIRRLKDLSALDFLKKGWRPDFRQLNRLERNIKGLSRQVLYKDRDWSLVYFMCLTAGWKRSDLEELIAPLQITRQEKKSLLASQEISPVLDTLRSKNLSPGAIYQILSPLPLEIILFIRAQTSVNIIGCRIDKFFKEYRFVSLSITGNDLRQLGIPSGRPIGKALNTLLHKKIDGKLKNRRDELHAAAGIKKQLDFRGHSFFGDADERSAAKPQPKNLPRKHGKSKTRKKSIH